MKQPTAIGVRTVQCPRCNASPGHPCVEVRRTGHAGKHYGATRRNHVERIVEYVHAVR